MKAKDTDIRSLLYIQSHLWSLPGYLAALQSLGLVNIDLTANLETAICSQIMILICTSPFFFNVFNRLFFHDIKKASFRAFLCFLWKMQKADFQSKLVVSPMDLFHAISMSIFL